MFDVVTSASSGTLAFLSWLPAVLMVLLGFSVVIFVHELGHFVVAKLCGVRVDKFAVGFGKELIGFTRGETRYCFNAVPLGGYVKMLGQEDVVTDADGEWMLKDDPRSFANKPVGQRMLIVSAGVIMNVLFAAFLFMIVFMIGREELSPVVGPLMPEGPAMRGGLEMGDEIVGINGRKVEDFADIKMSVVLADPHEFLNIRFRRGDKIEEVQVRPEPGRDNLLQIGFHPASSCEIHTVYPQDLEEGNEGLMPGDEIVEVEGAPIRDFTEVLFEMIRARGNPVKIKANRPNRSDPSANQLIEAHRRLPLTLLAAAPGNLDTQHLLGLVPPRKVTEVEEDSRAWLAGFKAGDVIIKWGDTPYPTHTEIGKSVRKNVDRDIRVQVRRAGEKDRIDLVVRPKLIKTGVFGGSKATIGLVYDDIDDGELVVSDVLPLVVGRTAPTPASRLGISRGDRILKVDGEPVGTWYELINVLVAKAGADVQITYRTAAGQEQTKPMAIPHSIWTLAKMPPLAKVIRIAGESEIVVKGKDGKEKRYIAGDWRGARKLLDKHVGETIEVVYRDATDITRPREVKTEIHVTPHMLDPWVGRVYFGDVGLIPLPLIKVLKTSNPFYAMKIGIKKTYYFLAHVYLTMKRIVFSQTVGIEHISGPVGIIKTGALILDAGFARLLYFLGFISANLAVINFLPLPIVDGGLMVFLIIEKIKGKPVSLKTQVVTQIIGLALIIATFVFVTYLDLTKL